MQKSQELLEAFYEIAIETGLYWFYRTRYQNQYTFTVIDHVLQVYQDYLHDDFGMSVYFAVSDDDKQDLVYRIHDCSLESLTLLKLTIGANG